MPERTSFNPLATENLTVGVAVGAVLAGTLGLAVFNPFTGEQATADTSVAASAQSVPAGDAGAARAPKGTSPAAKAVEAATVAKQEALKQGYAVPPRKVNPSEVIKLAEKQVGITEGKKGQTKFHDWFVSTPAAKATAKRDGGFSVKSYNGAQWCNMFVSWLGAQTGVKNMGWDAYTVQHATWFKKTDRWGKKPKPGAVVFYDWQKGSKGSIGDIDHVGIVVKDKGNGKIKTIEGNTDNAVEKHVRDRSEVVGYGYPDYDG